ncbi:MAG TPA: ATP-binding protein [Candidatus Saccharimonadaceae bacterium]|nr:ATP-binding protein [Candidatus Saccharimonadaceae bacterium]
MKKRGAENRPSDAEIRLRSELDRTRRDVSRLKREIADPKKVVPESPAPAPAPEALVAPPAARESDEPEMAGLRAQVEELSETRQRLSKLYFNQVEENRKRAGKLHQILENLCQINSHLDLDALLQRLCATIRDTLGFGVVLIRLREPGTQVLRARAYSGITPEAWAQLQTQDVGLDEFVSWLRDEFKVGRSYFISHTHAFNRALPAGFTADLGSREEWEWHPDDVLLVPLFNRAGELAAYFSVDDPSDRLVPSSENIELLEIFGNHAVVAIENARLYRQLEQHTRELEEAGRRMREVHALKSNFVSTVSHELRTPLTAIRAYVDTLLAPNAAELPEDQRRRFLTTISEESQRLSRLIESVLDLNKFDSGNVKMVRQDVDLKELLEESEQLLAPVALASQVNLKVVMETADTRVDADRDQLRQLVLHLGSNAIKFTPAGGTVRMVLGSSATEMTLQVEDTGIGIPAEALEKIFDRFYQVDSSLVRRYGGTGLGLAICKSIVDWHGGHVFVESEPGHGSRFTVRLPRTASPQVLVRPSETGGPGAAELLRRAIAMVAHAMNARVVSLLAPDTEGGGLRIEAALGLDESVVREARSSRGGGVAGWVATQRRPVCVSGQSESGDVAGSHREQYRSTTFLSVPLEGPDGLIGVLNVTDPVDDRPFDAEDCDRLLQLAGRVASAWLEARGVPAETGADVEGALRGVLQRLERTAGKVPDRVRLARALARECGLDEADAGLVSFAARAQEVGTNALSEDAATAAPGHGADLVRPIETLGAVRELMVSHHEAWDGTGYPRGLAGEAIPIGARILALVDAWESLVVGRPKRPARSRTEAMAELARLSGRQYDPALVARFPQALAACEKAEASNSGSIGPTPGSTGEPAMNDAGR